MTATIAAGVPTPAEVRDSVRPPVSGRRLAGEQAQAAAAQLAAGAGNLVFAVLAARGLDQRGFAELATFLALYLGVHLPGGAIAAAGAVGKGGRAQLRIERLLGLATAVALWVFVAPFSRITNLRPSLVVLLGVAAIVSPVVAGGRGRRYAAGDITGVGASLLAEPAVRLAVGVPLLSATGPVGGAVGAVAGGWAAALVLAHRPRVAHTGVDAPSDRRGLATATAFVLLAVVQNQDLVLANAVLPAAEASRFAVVSALGGVVAFATATVPLVLLPRARRGESGVLATAVAAAALLGGGATLLALVAPDRAFAAVFGTRYASAASIAPLYLVAMAALGTARVLAAHRCAQHRRPALTIGLLAAGAAGHAVLVARADGAADAVAATLGITLVLAAGLVVAEHPWLAPGIAARVAGGIARRVRPEVVAVAGCAAVGLGLRLVINRGLWVDEAIGVDLARRSFGGMLDQLRATDVHPPLHAAILWVSVRLGGASELAVRLPSIVAGAALVPVLWLAGRSLYDRRTGLIAAALAAISPLLVWYSQEARMYALFMLFAVLAVWAQVQAVRRGRVVHWAAYGVASVALVCTHYFAILVVAVQQAGFVAVVFRQWRRGDGARTRRIVGGWLGSTAVIALALAPLVPFAIDQWAAYADRRAATTASIPAAAGAAATSADRLSIYAVLANGAWAVVGFHADRTMAQIVALWPLGMLAALVLLGRRRTSATTLVALVSVVPAAVLYAIGLYKRDLFELRYFAATAPLSVLLAARVLTTMARRRLVLGAAVVAAAGILAVSLIDQQLNGANPRLYDFRGALDEIGRRAQPGDVVLYAPSYLATVVDYYGEGLAAAPLGSTAAQPGDGVFVLATYRTIGQRRTASTVGTNLARLGESRQLIARFDRPNVRVWELR